MKNGKRLTLKQKILLKSKGLNPSEWLRVKENPNGLLILNKETGKIVFTWEV